ncbi:MAG: PEP-CTERM sorting domain-containing protein [Planctomycetota bacterium]
MATTLGTGSTAEADVHYSSVDQQVNYASAPGGNAAVYNFSLAGSAFFSVANVYIGPGSEGFAGFQINAPSGTAMFGGFTASGYGNNTLHVQRHASGGLVSAVSFLMNAPGGYYGSFASMASQIYGPFVNPGNGFIGFKFDIGLGTQYGWAQVDMDGPQMNSFTLIDYAYADPGESISFGQIPEPGSMGMLALGAFGLIVWRRSRPE